DPGGGIARLRVGRGRRQRVPPAGPDPDVAVDARERREDPRLRNASRQCDRDRGQGQFSHTPDQAMQQATVNLFTDMGVEPANLQVGADPLRPLVRGDKTVDTAGPLTTIASPLAGSVAHSGGRVTVRGTATDVSGAVAGVEVSVDGGATWRPAQGAAD